MSCRIYLFCGLILAASCSTKETIQSDGAMEGTIPKGAFVTFMAKDELQRGDVVVFNFRGDYVSKDARRILRIVGMPGDTLEIRKGDIYINRVLLRNPRRTKFTYYVRAKTEARNSILWNKYFRQLSHLEYLVALSQDELPEMSNSREIDSIGLFITDSSYEEKHIIKDRSFKYFNSHFLGPIIIPKKGDQFTQYINSISTDYGSLINEGGMVKSDCYFLMGDNRFFCYDSKYLGVIPEAEILGVVDSVSLKPIR